MFELNEEQNTALKAMLSGANCFITGEAGTGKTTVIRDYLKRTKRNAVIVAPTGVAALNAGGVTIHSFFRLPCTVVEYGELEPLRSKDKKQKRLIRATDVIVIDEISMVRSDIFSAIDTRLRQVCDGSKPFGGKQLIVSGDFFQLPPFATTKEERKYIDAAFGGLFAFQCSEWREAGFETFFFKTIHRQASDPLFAKLLAAVRKRDFSSLFEVGGKQVTAIDALNLFVCNKPNAKAISLCTTRAVAAKLNTDSAAAVHSTPVMFTAKIQGDFPVDRYPTDEGLELKVGERVMALANNYDGRGLVYCNGDLGTIKEIKDKVVVVSFDSGVTTVVSAFEWKTYSYSLHEYSTGKLSIEPRETGSFEQIPLRLAYATTIHKCQGLSLSHAHIVLGRGCFAAGQMYTALSRVRTLCGLSVERAVREKDFFFSEAVVDFYRKLEEK